MAFELEASTGSWTTWTTWVTPRGRSLWVLAMPGRRTNENGSSSLPTLTATDAKGRGYHYQPGTKIKILALIGALKARMLPTLVASNADRGARRSPNGRKRAYSLIEATAFPELTAMEWRDGKAADLSSKPTGGSLSPPWCEAFMGFPAGWTLLGDSAANEYERSASRSSRRLRKPSGAP